MTNAEIILAEQITRGISEDMHTFARWKELGYKVRKGEHGIETRLWKYSKGKSNEDANEETDIKHGRCYMAKAYLFKRSQVEEVIK